MTAQEIIRKVQDDASEYLEMSKDPATMVAGILANKIVELFAHIEYLEKRIQHGSNY